MQRLHDTICCVVLAGQISSAVKLFTRQCRVRVRSSCSPDSAEFVCGQAVHQTVQSSCAVKLFTRQCRVRVRSSCSPDSADLVCGQAVHRTVCLLALAGWRCSMYGMIHRIIPLYVKATSTLSCALHHKMKRWRSLRIFKE